MGRMAFCAALLGAMATGLGAQAPAAPGLDQQLAIYNALPDTATRLAVGADGDALLPLWLRDMTLTRQETAALVALAGAYGPTETRAAVDSGQRKRNPLEYVAGAALALKTQDVLSHAQPGSPATLCCATTDAPRPRQQRVIARPPSERVVRLIAGLESCPGAFAALALQVHRQHPGSQLDQLAIRARTDRVEFATRPDAQCAAGS